MFVEQSILRIFLFFSFDRKMRLPETLVFGRSIDLITIGIKTNTSRLKKIIKHGRI